MPRSGCAVLAILLVLVGLVVVPIAYAAGDGTCVRMGRDLVVSPGERCAGDALVVGGNLRVQGEVLGNAVALGGSVEVAGRVSGDAIAVGGEVVLEPQARVEGGVVVLAGHLRRAPQAVVLGGFWESGALLPSPEADRPFRARWGATFLLLPSLVIVLGLCWSLAMGMRLVWPTRTRVMVEMLRRQWPLCLGMGLACTVVLSVAVPVATLVLLLLIVGVLLIPVLYLVVGLVYALGLAVVALALAGGAVEGMRRPQDEALRVAVALGALLVAMVVPAWLVPCLVPLWVPLIPSIGLGALLLSRVGTMRWIAEPAGGRSL